ncbi:hypothetical protein BDZ45DRAFT_209813 [Acephala macrosclerotiorum]|nr:hypothetical protein BDZ45DRAFT_209813 [Acephala macrosclerotiorum]
MIISYMYNIFVRHGLYWIVGISSVLWLFSTTKSATHPMIIRSSMDHGAQEKAQQSNAGNRTLGFGAVFISILPFRTDQSDIATLLAHMSGLDITIVPGVDPTEIHEVALPAGGFRPEKRGELGCWRSHLNVLKTIVQQRLETALIMEGDIDWDPRVKEQMVKVAANIPDATKSFEVPYGKNWSILWMGQCLHRSNPENPGSHVIYKDETVPNRDMLSPFDKAEFKIHGLEKDGYRMIVDAWAPICLAAYAVTLSGAVKILYELGYHKLSAPIDVELMHLVQEGTINGLAVVPALMSQYKTGSRVDSNINEISGEFWGYEAGYTGRCMAKSVHKELRGWVYRE